MSRKNKGGFGPIPEGNRSQFGPDYTRRDPNTMDPDETGLPQSDQDPKRRLGNYQTAGEAAFRQPGGKNDANR